MHSLSTQMWEEPTLDCNGGQKQQSVDKYTT